MAELKTILPNGCAVTHARSTDQKSELKKKRVVTLRLLDIK